MKMDEFLLKGSFMNSNEKRYIGIPTEPEETKTSKLNQFILSFPYIYSKIKKRFLRDINMKMNDEFLLDESFMKETVMKETERICFDIPTEPEEMGVLEFNQFIRKINDPEQIAFSHKYLEIKKQFLASHKFNNAKNKIKLTNKYLYSKYLQIVMLTQRMNKFIANMKEYFN